MEQQVNVNNPCTNLIIQQCQDQMAFNSILFSFSFLSVIGSLFMIILLMLRHRKNKVFYGIILLTISDLVFSMIQVPFYFAYILSEQFRQARPSEDGSECLCGIGRSTAFCYLRGFFGIFGQNSSFYSVIVTIYSFYVIMNRNSQFESWYNFPVLALLVFLLPLIFALSQTMIPWTYNPATSCLLNVKDPMGIYIQFMIYQIPFFIAMIFEIVIIYLVFKKKKIQNNSVVSQPDDNFYADSLQKSSPELKNHLNQDNFQEQNQSLSMQQNEANPSVNTQKNNYNILLIFPIAFFLCWSGFLVSRVIEMFDLDQKWQQIISKIGLAMTHLDGAVNAIIYGYFIRRKQQSKPNKRAQAQFKKSLLVQNQLMQPTKIGNQRKQDLNFATNEQLDTTLKDI